MNISRIEILLEKFFEGNTSLEEEKELKEFFLKDEVPAKFLPLREIFLYADEESRHHSLNESFDNKLFKEMDNTKRSDVSTYRKIYLYIASGVAATVLIVIGLFNLVDTRIDQKDIHTAYQQTRNALLFVSEKLNQGMEPAAKVAKFSEGMQDAKKISAYGKGMKNLGKISKMYEKPKEILINKNN
ncbi:MAG: hypothetical protein K9J24_14965 [Bacteroidales bacterium]|nr:hypothetical protein [Bacteroidales bacterium]